MVSEPHPSSPPASSPRSLFSTSVFRPTFALLVPLPRLLPVSRSFVEGLELELPSRKLRSELFAPLPFRVSPPAAATAAAAFNAAVAASTAPCVEAALLSGLLSSLRFLSRASSSLALVPPPPPRPFAWRFGPALDAGNLPLAWSDESVGSGLVIAAATAALTAAAALELKLPPPTEGRSLSSEEEELVSTSSVRQDPYLGSAGIGGGGVAPFCRVLALLFFALPEAATGETAAATGDAGVAAAVAAAAAAVPLPLPLLLLLLLVLLLALG